MKSNDLKKSFDGEYQDVLKNQFQLLQKANLKKDLILKSQLKQKK